MNNDIAAIRPVQVAAENLRKTYQLGKETIEVLRGVTLEIREGETVSITGPCSCRADNNSASRSPVRWSMIR